MSKKNNKTEKTQLELLREYFKKNPNRDIPHPEIVDWATNEWKKGTGTVFRDPDRGIRRLHQDGYLIKVKKGVYRHNSDAINRRKLDDFTAIQKTAILKRGDYKCAQCGMGKKEGAELHVDHIIPKDWGGKSIIENGQVLCSRCNFLKKNLKQTESGKKMFIRMYEAAKKENIGKILDFCRDILEVYEKHNVNGHVKWRK
jgi:5-methylcytosine-specific restriction endonuclease McrA